MVPPPLDCLNEAEKDALIQALLARVEELCARLAAMEAENAALRARVSELEAKLNLPKEDAGQFQHAAEQRAEAFGLGRRQGRERRRQATQVA